METHRLGRWVSFTGTGKGRLLRMAKSSTVPHVEQGLCGGMKKSGLLPLFFMAWLERSFLSRQSGNGRYHEDSPHVAQVKVTCIHVWFVCVSVQLRRPKVPLSETVLPRSPDDARSALSIFARGLRGKRRTRTPCPPTMPVSGQRGALHASRRSRFARLRRAFSKRKYSSLTLTHT